MNLLSVKNLVVSLANGVAVVDDISFEIAAGETFALLGESGCGKSMTALSLVRLLPDGMRISAGNVSVAEVEVSTLPEREMRAQRGNKLAMIFQEPGLSLNPVMTVGEQIAEVLKLHSAATAENRGKKIATCKLPETVLSCYSKLVFPMHRAVSTNIHFNCRVA